MPLVTFLSDIDSIYDERHEATLSSNLQIHLYFPSDEFSCRVPDRVGYQNYDLDFMFY